MQERHKQLEIMKALYPEKFPTEERIFKNIHPGNRIFIGTGCGEPQYLVKALINYVTSNPKAFFDTELLQVWTLGVAPYADAKFKDNFRHNSFFIGNNTRDAVNQGLADYTPVFLSQVPGLFQKKLVPVDVALIQTSLPDEHGFMSLGISVDIVKAAAENATIVIAQVNARMPRVLGDTFINIKDVDFIIPCDEPLLEFEDTVADDIAQKIGTYVARIVQDGDTIQVGYGSIPNAILAPSQEQGAPRRAHRASDRRHRGPDAGAGHRQLAKGAEPRQDRGGLLHGQDATPTTSCTTIPAIEFRPVNYTNNPTVLARQKNMTAINSALEIDLSGQATAESLGKTFYSGIGGQADFMRGAILSQGGKTILAIQSTAENETVSRIVPFLKEGAGVTLSRGDIHYVVTEYGIAYLHGKNIRERAMDLIAIAHPKFRQWLIEEAKKRNLIYNDQAFIPGVQGEYPEELEAYKTTRTGLRPAAPAGEALRRAAA